MKVGTVDLSKVIHLNPHLAIQEPVKKKAKYNNQRTEIEGEHYDSKKEAKRSGELKLMEKAGKITGLSRQVKFNLLSFSYIADFVYYDIKQRTWVVEDVKSEATKKLRVYLMKKKAMFNELGIIIKEI